jgi:hypothetical protein
MKRPRRYPFFFLLLGFSVSFVHLFFSPPCLARQKKTTLEIPAGSVGMIGYGSLMSLSSMEQSLGRKYKGPTYQIHLAGFERTWTHLRPFNEVQSEPADNVQYNAYYVEENVRIPVDGSVELDICHKKDGRINAVLYVIPDKDIIKFDKRERTYERVDVTDKVEEYRIAKGKVYAYAGLPDQAGKPSPDPRRYILFKEFFDQVTSACDGLGQQFRAEFDASTRPINYPIVPFVKVVWEKAK